MWIKWIKVSPKNVILISPLLMREIKEIRSCTKGWRPLPIGFKGSLVIGVAFLPSSFKILILVTIIDSAMPLFLSICSGLTLFILLLPHFTEFSPFNVEHSDF